MPDTAAAIQEQLKKKIKHIHEDRISTFAVMLGKPVMTSMTEKIGEDGALAYLEALEKFGRLVDQKKDLDLFEMMPVHQLTAFSNFAQYQTLLSQIAQRMRMRKDASLKPVLDALEAVLKIGNTEKPAASQATAAEHPQYYSSMFTGKSLPQVPLSMMDRDNLPKSYPDFKEVREIVVSRFNKSEFRPKLYSELNSCVRKSLKAVALHRRYSESKVSDPREYLAEAQQYLMDFNWIGYGRDTAKIAVACDRLDRGGIPAFVDYDDNTLVIASDRTVAYAFLGVNLEKILRKSVMDLANDVRANFTIPGKQTSLDVIVAASSSVIQEAALSWLEHIQDAFNNTAEKQP